MTEGDLYALYQLHKVDARIVELKVQAAQFDPTKEIRLAIKKSEPELERAKSAYEKAVADHKDAELRFKSLFDRLNAQMNFLYSGKITNPREIEAVEKDIESLRDRANATEQEQNGLVEHIAPAKEAYDKLHADMEVLKKKYKALYVSGKKAGEALQLEYKELVDQRPAKVAAVPAGLLAQYDAIRNKYNGIGMGEVINKNVCGACGTELPSRTVLSVHEGKLTTCESCHRILFHVLPYVS